MDEVLLGAEASAAALDQPVSYGEGEHRPQRDTQRQRQQETDVEPLGSSRLHRGASLVLVVGVCVIQLAWLALLVYAAIWSAALLPF